MLTIPMCWKCCNRITEEATDDSKVKFIAVALGAKSIVLKGCKEEPNIKSYNDARTMCPLFKEKEVADD